MNKYLEKVAARKRMAFIDRHIGEALGDGPFSIRSKQMGEDARYYGEQATTANYTFDKRKKELFEGRSGPAPKGPDLRDLNTDRLKASAKFASKNKAYTKSKDIAARAVRNARLRVGGTALGLAAIGLGAKKFLSKNEDQN